jgi:tight adherence protein B
MDVFVNLLGKNGMIIFIGVIFFLLAFKYSNNLFKWIEDQTFGTRSYIEERLALLFVEVHPDHITYLLLFLSVGSGLLALLIFFLLGQYILGIFMALVLSFLGFKIPRPVINWLVERRIKYYQSQLVDALTLLGNGIRAGLSVPQALGIIVDEMPAPVSQEFSLLIQQNRIGVPLEECFENLAKRVPLEDNDMFVAAVNILRETGGNLAEVFDTIVLVIRERIRLQQKIETYTASGMFQGFTIASMPFLIGVIYFVSDPNSMTRMFTTPLGIVLTIVALAFDFAGLFVILKIVKIKV